MKRSASTICTSPGCAGRLATDECTREELEALIESGDVKVYCIQCHALRSLTPEELEEVRTGLPKLFN